MEKLGKIVGYKFKVQCLWKVFEEEEFWEDCEDQESEDFEECLDMMRKCVKTAERFNKMMPKFAQRKEVDKFRVVLF